MTKEELRQEVIRQLVVIEEAADDAAKCCGCPDAEGAREMIHTLRSRLEKKHDRPVTIQPDLSE
jgi:hypothetical protein